MTDYIFVSYAHAGHGETLIPLLQAEVKRRGFDLWWDKEIPAGSDWRIEIDQMIRRSTAMLALIDKISNKSKYVHYEYGVALGANVPIIPILCEHFPTSKTTRIHPRLDSLHYVDFRGPKDFDRLMDRLEDIRETRSQPDPQVESPPSSAFTVLQETIENSLGPISADGLLYSLAARGVLSPEEFGRLSNALVKQRVRSIAVARMPQDSKPKSE